MARTTLGDFGFESAESFGVTPASRFGLSARAVAPEPRGPMADTASPQMRRGLELGRQAPGRATLAPDVPQGDVSVGKPQVVNDVSLPEPPKAQDPADSVLDSMIARSRELLDQTFAGAGQQVNAPANRDDTLPDEPTEDDYTWGEVGKDALLSVGEAVNEFSRMGFELADLVTRPIPGDMSLDDVIDLRSQFDATADIYADARSPNFKAKQAELHKATGEGFVSAAKTVLTDPVLAGDLFIKSAPYMLGIAGPARAAFKSGLARAAEKGLRGKSAQKFAQKRAERAVLAANATIGGVSAGNQARQSVTQMSPKDIAQSPVYQQYREQGLDDGEARRRLGDRAATIATTVSAPISGAASKLTSGLEARFFNGAISSSGGVVSFALGLGKAGVREAGEEALQEGGEGFAQNVGQIFSGADPDKSAFEGVSGQAGIGAALGLGTGGAIGAIDGVRAGLQSRRADTEQPGDSPDATRQGDSLETREVTGNDEEAVQGLGIRPGSQFADAVEGPEAQAAQQRNAGGRPEQRPGDVGQPESAEQPLGGEQAPAPAGAFDPASELAQSLERTAPVDVAARDAAESPDNDRPTPTESQKQAGNYRKGHVRVAGLDVSIENPNGSVRSGQDASGKKWRSKVAGHYGYVRGTQGNDGDQVDVFVKPGTEDADTAYVIDQQNDDGSFDEHKAVLGTESLDEARSLYRANYPDNWQGDKAITAMPIDQFKDWLKNGDLTQPAAPKVPSNSLRRADIAARQNDSAQEIPEAPDVAPEQADTVPPQEEVTARTVDNETVDTTTLANNAPRAPKALTRGMRTDLTDLGYEKTDIDAMRPDIAAEVIAEGRRKPGAAVSRTEKARQRIEKMRQIDNQNDDIVTAIRKLGGINTDLESDWRGRLSQLNAADRRPGLPGIEQTGNAGLTLDALAEQLAEQGYIGTPGDVTDQSELAELLSRAESGEPVFGNAPAADALARQAAEYEQTRADAEDVVIDEPPDAVQQETGSPAPPIPAEALEPIGSGQAFDESEYEPDWDEPTRQLHELFDSASEFDADAAESIMSKGESDPAVARQLIEVINNGRQRQGQSALAVGQSAGSNNPRSNGGPPAPETAQAPDPTLEQPGQAPGSLLGSRRRPPQQSVGDMFGTDGDMFSQPGSSSSPDQSTRDGDLFGDDTRDAQAMSDEKRRRDERRSPNTDVPADVDGGLFARQTRDIEDGTRFSRAYHGTPHQFDRFSLDAIGTGEGAAAYGWGLYFAGKREIADYYRQTLSIGRPNNAVQNAAQQILGRQLEREERSAIRDFADREDRADAVRWVKARSISMRSLSSADIGRLLDAYNSPSARGSLYQVGIPEAEELLDWNAPLRNQPQKVKDAITTFAEQNSSDLMASTLYAGVNDITEDIASMTGSDAYQRVSRERDYNAQAASRYFESMGIPGLRYRDAASRDGSGDSYNYVIWDENRVTVEAVNDELRQAEIQASRAQGSGALPSAAAQSASTNQEATDVEALRQALSQYLGRDDFDLASADVSTDSASAARELAPLFGKRIAFYETTDPQIDGFNGLALPGSDVVYLNVNAEVAHTALLGHELTHYLKRERPDLWSGLETIARQEMQNSVEYRAWLDRVMGGEGRTAANDELHEEMIADFIGDQFLKPSFWTRVMEQSEPGVGQRIAATLRRFLDNVLRWLNQRGFGGSRYFKDIERVLDAAAEAFSGYAEANVARNEQGYAVAGSRAPDSERAAESPGLKGLQLPNSITGDNGPEREVLSESDTESNVSGSRFDAPVSGDDQSPMHARFLSLGDQRVPHSQAMADAQAMTGLYLNIPVETATLPDLVPMRFDADRGIIEVSDTESMPRPDATMAMAEELYHGLDVLPTGNSIAASSPHFQPVGDVWSEAESAMREYDDIGRFLDYPLGPDTALSTARKSAELFARLGVLYNGNPEAMRRRMPIAHAALEEVHDAIQRSNRSLQRKIRPRADAGAQVRPDNAQDQPVDAGSGERRGNWRTDPGLERLRRALAKRIGGSRLGRRVPPSLESRRPARTANYQQPGPAPGSLPGAPRFSRARDTAEGAPPRRRFGRRPPPGKTDPFFEENRRLRDEHDTLWKKAGRIIRRELSPRGLLPANVFDAKIARDSQFEVVEFDVNHLVGTLEHAVKKGYGKPYRKLSAKQRATLQQALSGQVSDAVPADVQPAIVAMRRYIDHLSTEYIGVLSGQIETILREPGGEAGVPADALLASMRGVEPDERMDAARDALYDGYIAQGQAPDAASNKAFSTTGPVADALAKASTIVTIQGNLGSYVHRSYRAFDDPNWNANVSDEVANAARSLITERYREQGETDAEAARLAEVTINEILKNGTAYDSLEGFIKESKLGAKDLSVLQRRQQISPEIRALLGEYDDPRINFTKSATKMGRLIWNERFLNTVREQGMGVFLFEGTDRPPDATAQIAADGSETYSPLNGLWTYPEVEQAFKDALGQENIDGIYKMIVQLNGAVKFGKTILSPTTAARNWQSAFFFALANGHFNMAHMGKSLSGLREYFTRQGKGARLAYLRRLKELGVVYDTPYAGEMMRLLSDARTEDDLLQPGRFMGLKAALSYAQKFYQYGDDFWKIIGFENEKRLLMKRAKMSEADAEKAAAERIRNTYPTYSMVPKAIQSLRRFPLAGTFVSFPAEIIRTTGNMFYYVARDLNTPGMRSIGLQRGVGMSIAAGAFAGAQALSKALFDIDDDEEEAVRTLAAPWNRNSNIWFSGRDEKGELNYFDLSFLDPYNYFKRPVNAMMRDEPWSDQALEVVRELVTPFFGTDIAAETIGEVVWNKRASTGTPVYNENGSPLEISKTIANHLRKSLQPGIFSNLERTYKALEGQYSPSGRKYKPFDEGLAWVGWRKSTLDPKVALYYRSFEFNDALSDAQSDLYRMLRDPNEIDFADVRTQYADTLKARKDAFKDMSRIVLAARNNGMSDADIDRVLRSSSVSKDNIDALLEGYVPDWQVTDAAIRYGMKKADAVFDPKRADMLYERYNRAYELTPESVEQ